MQENTSSLKTYALVAGGILLFGLLIFGLEKLASQDPKINPGPTQTVGNDTRVHGNADAPVTLLEYSDFQCPACSAYQPIIKNLIQDFPDTVRIAYRYYPLKSIHKNAIISAKAAEAAHRQGKFWEMHDQLFEHQTDWAKSENPTDIFQTYAQAIGLDMDQFNTDIQSASVADAVTADETMAIQAEIPGTPSFFINGRKLENPQSYEAFKKVIEDELAKTTQTTENK